MVPPQGAGGVADQHHRGGRPDGDRWRGSARPDDGGADGGRAGGGTPEQGTGRKRAALPKRRHPLSNLTQTYEPARERASAGTLAASDPAPLPGSRSHRRRHVPAGGPRGRAGQLGADRDADGRDLQRRTPPRSSPTVSSVPASVYDTVGISSPANPVHAPPARAGKGGAPTWLAVVNGGPPLPVVFFYGAEFVPVPGRRALAVDPGPFPLRDLQPARADAVELERTAFANLSTFTFWKVSYTSRYVILESVERYSSFEPHRGPLPRPPAPRCPAGRGRRELRATADTFSLTESPTATCSTAPASPPASSPGSHRARSPVTSPCRPAR